MTRTRGLTGSSDSTLGAGDERSHEGDEADGKVQPEQLRATECADGNGVKESVRNGASIRRDFTDRVVT